LAWQRAVRWLVVDRGGRTVSENSKAKHKRRARRVAERAREGRFRQAPRVVIRADERSLTSFGGGAVLGELVRRIELIPALDAAIETVPRVGGLKPVKQRARGRSPGEALVAVAESMLCGGDSMLDLERVRADEAGAELRGVPGTPAASTACQLARRFRRSHLRAAEAAFAKCANAVDVQLGRRVDDAVMLDFDSWQVEASGRRKPGAAVDYQGQLTYQPLLCSWSQRARMLATELLSGPDSTRGEEPRALLARALDYLPEGHGEVSARFDSGFYRIDLLADCRKGRVQFSISVPRSSAMWSGLERIPEDAWEPADGLTDAEVAGDHLHARGLGSRGARVDRAPRRSPGRRALG
jgi:Transposase DDE domain group 1